MESFDMRRRHAMAALGAALAGGALPAARAQAYPARPVRFVVGYAAGSATDACTRFFAERIREATGQTTLVENRPGADGNLAAESVARAGPDAYTAFVAGNSTHAANVHLYRKLNYDPYKDFAPVTTFARVPYMLIANPAKVPAKTLREFIAFAKANPGRLTYASAAVASRVSVEQLKLAAGFDATNVNYKASPQAMTDLLGGQVDFYISDIATALVQARAGKVTPLAVTITRRVPAAPDVPTIAESGYPDYDFFSWLALWVPAGAPAEDVRRLAELVNQSMDSDAGREFLQSRGLLGYPGSPQMLAELQARDTERWGRAVRAAGMQPQ
ncbi:MAG: tripartite tricarboxylate transporter substrate binding protein [Burkholderiaceae bacterium]